MISAIKFGSTQFLTSNPPANTVVLAFDFDNRNLYLMDSSNKILLSEFVTSYLFDENGKIKQEFLETGAIAEVPTKLSQLENDSEFITKDANNLTYYLTKIETITEITNAVTQLNTKLDTEINKINHEISCTNQEIENIQQQLAGLSGTYVYIGKINMTSPTQSDLTNTAIELKGNVNTGYVLVDLDNKEWYYDGIQWNDFGSSSEKIVSWNDIIDKPNLVEYTAIDDKTATIILDNHQNLLGTDTSGSTYNLAMVSQWNVADFGSKSLPCNLNAVSGIVTINDEFTIATTKNVDDAIISLSGALSSNTEIVVNTVVDEKMIETIGTDEELSATFLSIAALTEKINNI